MGKSFEKSEAVALVIDDTEVIRALLSEALTDKGYHAHTAENAREGIKVALQLHPDIIFCDTYMPDLDGITTIRQIRKALPEAVIVLTNSLPSEEISAQACKKDFDYLLNKPFGLEDLWEILEKVDKRPRDTARDPKSKTRGL